MDKQAISGKTTIAILPAGWVFVGKLSQNGDKSTLTQASNIRRYWTKAGLGPVAEQGPNAEGVVLDKIADVTFITSQAIAYIACNEEAWV